MAAKIGRLCKVAVGSDKILGIGNWEITGVDTDQFEDTEFGDGYKTYLVGLKEAGQISFSGYYDPADSTGQDVLRTAWTNGTKLTTLKLYIDSTSYWMPESTNSVSGVYITSWMVNSDKSGLMQCNFTAKISGYLELI